LDRRNGVGSRSRNPVQRRVGEPSPLLLEWRLPSSDRYTDHNNTHIAHNTAHAAYLSSSSKVAEWVNPAIMDDRRASTSSDLGAADEEEDHIRVICR